MPRSYRKCQVCNTLYATDSRNSERQRFCSSPDCQRERRRREQRLRRTKVLERLWLELLKDDPKPRRGLQKASLLPEASIDTQSPILIGLISMLIDSEDREEIAKVLRRLWRRGVEILNPQLSQRPLKYLPGKHIQKSPIESQAKG